MRALTRCCLAVAGAAVVFGGSVAVADQDVTFDGAGDAAHVSIIGDSTLAAVRWYADYGPLERFNFVLSAESCRRTIEQSCISREGYRSANVIAAMRSLDGRLGEVLVVMSGYNDPIWTIDEAIEGVVDEARSQSVDHVVWLTLRTSPDVDYHDPQEQSSINTFREYNEQLVEAAAASDGYLQVADWATWSNGAADWFEHDGVHLTPRGVDAVTTFIGGVLERVLAGEDVSPAAAPWTVLVPGAEGEAVASVQSAMIDAGIEVPGGADGVFGNDTMAAVAEFQRRDGELQVTGAVDVATARALGVFVDEEIEAASPVDPDRAAPSEPDDVGVVTEPATEAAAALLVDEGGSNGRRSWILAVGVIVAAMAVAVVARRRWVVAQRRARRWARVHPATSPHRSVADLRRSGELPTVAADDQRERDDVDQLSG